MEHELSAAYGCAHGTGLAVVIPAVMTYNMKHDVNRFARPAVNVWGCQMDFDRPGETAKEGIEAFRHFLKRIYMPAGFKEIGGGEEDIAVLAHKCCCECGGTGTVDGFVTLTEQDVINIYRLTDK